MRVHKILIALAILIGNYAIAQNTYPWPSSGNVGIGTASPQTNLHVIGNLAAANNGTNGFVQLRGDSNYIQKWKCERTTIWFCE